MSPRGKPSRPDAHLYGLTEEEFAHILGTFPLVAEGVKAAARTAYRDVALGVIP